MEEVDQRAILLLVVGRPGNEMTNQGGMADRIEEETRCQSLSQMTSAAVTRALISWTSPLVIIRVASLILAMSSGPKISDPTFMARPTASWRERPTDLA